MRESTFTTAIGKLLPPAVYKLKLMLPYTAGVADSWYSGPAGDVWVEWKYLKSIPRVVDLVGGKHPIVTKLQQHWLRGRHAKGRRVAVIVGCREGAVTLPGIEWTIEMSREDFQRRMIAKPEVAGWITHLTTRSGRRQELENSRTARATITCIPVSISGEASADAVPSPHTP